MNNPINEQEENRNLKGKLRKVGVLSGLAGVVVGAISTFAIREHIAAKQDNIAWCVEVAVTDYCLGKAPKVTDYKDAASVARHLEYVNACTSGILPYDSFSGDVLGTAIAHGGEIRDREEADCTDDTYSSIETVP